VANQGKLYSLKDTLEEHCRKYKVYVAAEEFLMSIVSKPGTFQDFSLIGDGVVAFYTSGQALDPAIDKKIVFDTSNDLFKMKNEEFKKILEHSEQFKDTDSKDFQLFVDRVFKHREISRYINVKNYHKNEPFDVGATGSSVRRLRLELLSHPVKVDLALPEGQHQVVQAVDAHAVMVAARWPAQPGRVPERHARPRAEPHRNGARRGATAPWSPATRPPVRSAAQRPGRRRRP
jgi:hypothetical protein